MRATLLGMNGHPRRKGCQLASHLSTVQDDEYRVMPHTA